MRATDSPDYHNEWYHRNKHRLAEARRQRNRNDYRRKLEFIIHIKTQIGCCADCGFQCDRDNHPVFEFDHRNPDTKTFNIADGKKRSIRDLQAEIDKCDMVCANCHRLRSINSNAWANRRQDQQDKSQLTLWENDNEKR